MIALYRHIPPPPSGLPTAHLPPDRDGILPICDDEYFEDDIVGKFEGAAAQNSYNSKRMGGLIGGTDDLKKVLTATVESCTNYGNVFTHIGCRTGGFIGHSNIRIIGCANQGAILGDVYNSDHGPAWACGYSGQSSGEWVNVSSCTMGGYVGSYTTYKDNPTSAPAATVHNAFSYKNDEYYDPTINNKRL